MRRCRVIEKLLLALVAMMWCTGSWAQEETYALKGTVVTPEQVIANGTVWIAGQRLKAVGTDLNLPHGTTLLETDGIILPGFIDLHNHITWNVLPRWKPGQAFPNRYEWQALPIYGVLLPVPHDALYKQGLGCAMNRYAEVKAITQGETSLVGSLGAEKCIEGMARNLDFYTGFYGAGVVGKEKLRYEVFPLEKDNSTVEEINAALDKKDLTAFLAHVSEGKDASAAREFAMFGARGFLREGVSIIHGVALKQADFHLMKEKNVGFIWSPRSNIELYGVTANVAAASSEKVKIALAPDWSPTASNGMLEELMFAATWNVAQRPPLFSNQDLVRMATAEAAKLAKLDTKIGTLAPDRYADVVVLKTNETNAYDGIVHAGPADVELVIIDGSPVYGNLAAMKKLLPHQQLEPLTLCGAQKAIYFGSEAKAQGITPKTWTETTRELDRALREWGSSLAPLADCGN